MDGYYERTSIMLKLPSQSGLFKQSPARPQTMLLQHAPPPPPPSRAPLTIEKTLRLRVLSCLWRVTDPNKKDTLVHGEDEVGTREFLQHM